MAPFSCKVRNYCQNDFEAFIQLSEDEIVYKQAGDVLLFKAMREGIERPEYAPEKDLFLAEVNKSIAGWMNVYQENRINRIIVSGFVFPEYRGRGIASVLMDRVLKRAGELEARFVHLCLPQNNEVAKVFLAKFGFAPVRAFLELKYEFSGEDKNRFELQPPRFDRFNPGEEKELAVIQNTCFTGSWGFNPNSVEEIHYWLALTDSNIEDVIVERKKVEILGYCWAHMVSSKSLNLSQRKGRIHMLGVHPLSRGRGIGKKLITSGISFLKDKGAHVIELTTDEANSTARSLYESSGFTLESRNLWYEKRI